MSYLEKQLSELKAINTCYSKLDSLETWQLGSLHILLNLTSVDKLKELEQDLKCIAGIDSTVELRLILFNELLYYFTGEPDFSPKKPEPPKSIDYMAAIKESCGR